VAAADGLTDKVVPPGYATFARLEDQGAGRTLYFFADANQPNRQFPSEYQHASKY
jgi:hypothetical protein